MQMTIVRVVHHQNSLDAFFFAYDFIHGLKFFWGGVSESASLWRKCTPYSCVQGRFISSFIRNYFGIVMN